MTSLPLIDVNSSNAATTLPLLLKGIESADFISLDLELSGLGKTTKQCKCMEEHYQSLCAVVSSRAVLSLGVACFKWSGGGFRASEPVSLAVQVFNVWLLTQQPFVTDPSSAQFLIQHGFDFNKQYSLGLPYTPPPATMKTPSWQYSMEAVFAHLLECGVPVVLHNGWLDLLFLYHSFYGPLPPTSTSLMADLVEMFPAGIYDTKGIAQFKLLEEATYLEYVFRICQQRNAASCRRGDRHIAWQYPLQAKEGECFVEDVDIGLPSLPPQQLLLVQVCSPFADNGYCHAPNCRKSHDVALAIQQRQLLKVQKKRKRSNRNRHSQKKGKLDGNEVAIEIEESRDSSPKAEAGTDMTLLFQQDLAEIRAKLSGRGQDLSKPELRGSGQDLSGRGQGPELSRPAFGHRAGFDAFMTGYAFGCCAVECSEGVVEAGRELSGLEDTRNQLASRPGNWKVPLHILKSHFAKTSSTHSIAKERMRKILQSQAAIDGKSVEP